MLTHDTLQERIEEYEILYANLTASGETYAASAVRQTLEDLYKALSLAG